jgi:hypothetical protein
MSLRALVNMPCHGNPSRPRLTLQQVPPPILKASRGGRAAWEGKSARPLEGRQTTATQGHPCHHGSRPKLLELRHATRVALDTVAAIASITIARLVLSF